MRSRIVSAERSASSLTSTMSHSSGLIGVVGAVLKEPTTWIFFIKNRDFSLPYNELFLGNEHKKS